MAEQAGLDLDTSRPHPARVYDYLLGGKSNFAADRALAEKMLQGAPDLRIAARENRAFLGRAVQYLAGEAGVRQFLDIGTGLPTADNVHEVAQRIAPESRVVYADNDPMVLAHARVLLASAPEGRTAYVHADLRDPAQILTDPQVRDVLDFDRPIALVLVAVLHFLPDEDKPAEVVAALLDGQLPRRLTHRTGPRTRPGHRDGTRRAGRRHPDPATRLRRLRPVGVPGPGACPVGRRPRLREAPPRQRCAARPARGQRVRRRRPQAVMRHEALRYIPDLGGEKFARRFLGLMPYLVPGP